MSPVQLKRRSLAAALLGVGVALGLLAPTPASSSRAEPLQEADRVVVVKSERRLYLLKAGRPIRSYPVHLGLNPIGQKQRAGDFRTPEGEYTLDSRNTHSDFFLSIHVSYPSALDAANARRRHWAPGGSIMIHGEPNVPRKPLYVYKSIDWTDGCIALSNEDMLEFWLLTRRDTPIEIRP
jgi:murein L,D-transpeptidase YafK